MRHLRNGTKQIPWQGEVKTNSNLGSTINIAQDSISRTNLRLANLVLIFRFFISLIGFFEARILGVARQFQLWMTALETRNDWEARFVNYTDGSQKGS